MRTYWDWYYMPSSQSARVESQGWVEVRNSAQPMIAGYTNQADELPVRFSIDVPHARTSYTWRTTG
ncbi:MAG: hypothetical protein HOO93_04870 [Methyloglobulus sp.]|nr:hypothetical protein [Methyloglobulus sp.]